MSGAAPLRVGVIGCGGIAQMMHLPTLAERPDLFTIQALADVSRPVLEAVGSRYGVTALSGDFRELVARADVDAVLLLASGSHHAAATAALSAGKHLFVEKPLGFSLRETEAIAAVARESRGRLMVGYHKRFDPHYLRARDEIRAMRDLRYVEVTVLHPDDAAFRTHHVVLPLRPWTPLGEPELNRGAVAEATVGALAGLVSESLAADAPQAHRVGVLLLFQSLVHDINALRGILGEPERVVSAEVWKDGFAQHSLTRFAGDVHVSMSWVSLPGVKHYEERLRFVSPEKRVTLVFPSPYLRHAPTPLLLERMEGDELLLEQRILGYEEAFRAELHHFQRCLADGTPPSPSVEDALGDARWIQEIAKAYAAPAPRR